VAVWAERDIGVRIGERNAVVDLLDVGVLGHVGLVTRMYLDRGRVDLEVIGEERLDLVFDRCIRPLTERVVETAGAESLHEHYFKQVD
jgi:hypothetical protein